MKLATVMMHGKEQVAVVLDGKYILLAAINEALGERWSTDMFTLVTSSQLQELSERLATISYRQRLESIIAMAAAEIVHAPLYRHPRKIWGIGMNYVQNDAELNACDLDEEPVSFMKPDTTIIGQEARIQLPPQSQQVTAEGELALIIGQTCRHVSEHDAPNYVAGLMATLDVTAADIHARHPRFLARAKSFDTFCALGSQLITLDDVPDILALTVQTYHNGQLVHENSTYYMKFRPWYIVSFLSQVMTLLPGDIIMTGTPGAVVIRDGDTVGCAIVDADGQPLLEPLHNGVQALS
ncbi:fumarylacetoacetate hydrolase family protein [Paenibacillus campi]|uniref:fumarylacetoacetate hydrolase family protein n=1 Tax=Paenibacillus campi TaxID=3106031 RepID=UPI002AFEF1DC|nr:fumarylacetoacetate hydrolase family protein [Paenibacillus sp. SGZ-1014]